MKIFYSGHSWEGAVPEDTIPDRKPPVMLTFYEFTKLGERRQQTLRRFRRYRAKR